MYPINFTADYISNVSVKEKQKKYYTAKPALFVEFNSKSSGDIDVLFDLMKVWDHSLVDDIYDEFTYSYSENKHVYGVVKNGTDVQNIKTGDVLGVALVESSEYGVDELKYLQVNTSDTYKAFQNSVNRHYKKVGSAILSKLKALIGDRVLELYPAVDGVDKFYKKNKFIYTDKTHSAMRWSRFL